MARRGSVLVATIMLVGVGCSSIPDTSRTGQVHDIRIMAGDLEPAEIHVRPGDEIRWLNYRTTATRIIFLDNLEDRVSCARGGWGSDMNDTTLKGNKAASLCFSKPGQYPYMARMEAEVPGGEIPVRGTVKVE